MGFLLSSLASELKAADKLKGKGRGPECQKKGALGPQRAKCQSSWTVGSRGKGT